MEHGPTGLFPVPLIFFLIFFFFSIIINILFSYNIFGRIYY